MAAMRDGLPVGMAASSFTSVSLDPPLVSLCVAHGSNTWPQLSQAPAVGLSVLAHGHAGTARQLAARDGDRFRGIPWEARESGAVAVKGACAFLEVAVRQFVAAGDHDIVVFEVNAFEHDPMSPPLVFHASSFGRVVAAETA